MLGVVLVGVVLVGVVLVGVVLVGVVLVGVLPLRPDRPAFASEQAVTVSAHIATAAMTSRGVMPLLTTRAERCVPGARTDCPIGQRQEIDVTVAVG